VVSDTKQKPKWMIVGSNGRLANSFLERFEISKDLMPPIVLSTRELGSRGFELNLEAIASNDEGQNVTIIWCSGSASNRSTSIECQNDEMMLRKFMDFYNTKVRFPPNLVYFSSGGTVYGNSPGIVNESSSLNPQTAYAEMKVRSEEFLFNLCREGRVSLSVLRLANLYGSKSSNSRLSLVDIALTKKDIYLTVNPTSTKQYGTYKDLAQFSINFINQFMPKPGSLVVKNVFPSHCYSIEEILDLTARHNPFHGSRQIFPPEDLSRYENVILTSIHTDTDIDFTWSSLQDHLEG
jgi:hypothetical protein